MIFIKRYGLFLSMILAIGLCFSETSKAQTRILFRSAQDELVLLPSINTIGTKGPASASDDDGLTWHDWNGFSTWPTTAYLDVIRRNGELLAFGVGEEGETSSYSGTRLWRSSDEGLTWTGGDRLIPDTDPWGSENQKVLLTSSGRLIVPITQLLAGEGSGPNLVGTIYSDDGGTSWTRSPMFGPPPGYPTQPEGIGEPAVVELANGKVWMLMRGLGGYLWQAWSDDDGATWGTPSQTTLTSPLAALNVDRIPGTDAIVAVWDNAVPGTSTDYNAPENVWNPRLPLSYAVSKDNAQTWSKPVVIDPNWSVIPGMIFSDTKMFVAYASSGTQVVSYDIQSLAETHLELHVNPFTGATEIKNTSASTTLMFDFYTAGSNPANAPLENVWVRANWNSITDQDAGGWEEVNSPLIPDAQQISELNLTGSKSIAPGAVVSLGNVYDITDTTKDLAFSYGLVGDLDQSVGNVVFVGGLHIRVNKLTGTIEIVNPEPVGIDFDGYVIQSGAGDLNTTTWNSLQDQTETGWEENSSTSSAISEVNLTSSSLLAAGGVFDLSAAYQGGVSGIEDMTFEYSLAGGQTILSGLVEYVENLPGDFDGDGDADGNDFLTWQRGFGSTHTTSDLADWEGNYGSSPLSAVSGVAAVPEPTTAGLLALALGTFAVGGCRRKVNS